MLDLRPPEDAEARDEFYRAYARAWFFVGALSVLLLVAVYLWF